MNKMSKFQKNDRRDSYMKLKQQLEDSEDNEDIEEQFDEAIECKLYTLELILFIQSLTYSLFPVEELPKN